MAAVQLCLDDTSIPSWVTDSFLLLNLTLVNYLPHISNLASSPSYFYFFNDAQKTGSGLGMIKAMTDYVHKINLKKKASKQ